MPDLILKKPDAIVMDVTGTLVNKSFMTYSQETREFLLSYFRDFLVESWNRTPARLCINFLRQDLAAGLTNAPPLAPSSATPQEQYEAVCNHLEFRFEKEWNKRCPSIGIFHITISDWGYKKGLLLTPVYPDVKTVLTRWRKQNIKLYINVGPSNFLRNVFSKTTDGNLLPLIDGHMNLMEGRTKNFGRLVQLLGVQPQQIIFITRLPGDARLARVVNVNSVIIVREDFAPKIYRALNKGGWNFFGNITDKDNILQLRRKDKPREIEEVRSSESPDSKEEMNPLEEDDEEEREKNKGKKGKDRKKVKSKRKKQFRKGMTALFKNPLGTSSKIDKEDDQLDFSNDLETMTSNYDEYYDPSPDSMVHSKDIAEFPIILSLEDLKWVE